MEWRLERSTSFGKSMNPIKSSLLKMQETGK